MMTKSKQRTEQHLIDTDGERIFRYRLPPHWVVREYRPDYGIDFAIEIFKATAPTNSKVSTTFETLGEHVFVQLKSKKSPKRRIFKVFGRQNVEKQHETLNNNDLVAEIETIPVSIETSELVTVERMGVGVPVVLVVADTADSKCYFVCLNDYIDKILTPRYGDYTSKASRTIQIPILNEVGDEVGHTALRWYAKRAKLYAAFQRFVYQKVELDYAWGSPNAVELARYFARRLALYDFWDDTEMWGVIQYYGAAVRRFLESGNPGLANIALEGIVEATGQGKEQAKDTLAWLQSQEVPELWRCLSILPRNYEDVCREWFLPTSVGVLSSYPPREWGRVLT